MNNQAFIQPALEVRDLVVEFRVRDGALRAIDNISFNVAPGEILGLVGESGSGKSVTGLAMLNLLRPPGRIASGSIRLFGEELVGRTERDMQSIRGRRIAMIFQDPSSTLNPVLRIDTQMIEAIRAHERVSEKAALARAIHALARVGIASAHERVKAYPHQFSGGMRQRIAIATAMLNRPAVLVADEPTTALDVTIQAQILFEIQKLAEETGTAMIWITHDLSVVAGLADRVAIMYAGRLVEQGPVSTILQQPAHHYTAGLLGSIPSNNEPGKPLRQIPGLPPTLGKFVAGCTFRPRCPAARADCEAIPAERRFGQGRSLLCHHPIGEVPA